MGERSEMFCTDCGAGLAGGEQFCRSCGAQVQASSPVAATQAPPPATGQYPPPPAYAATPRRTGSRAKVIVVLLALGIIVVGVTFALTAGPLGGGQVGDCVLSYRYTGIQRHEGWTRAECDQWCYDHVEPRGVALDCWFEG